MSSRFQVQKVSTLPGALTADTLYFVADAVNPNAFELHVSNNTGTATRHLPTYSEIDAMVAGAVGAATAIKVVADITARNNIPVMVGSTQIVLVLDATADTTVLNGAATYINTAVDPTVWVKISEYESMDVVLEWSAIVGGPGSTPVAIDDAVSKAHTHANLTVLNALTADVNGNLMYADAVVATLYGATEW